MMLEIQFLAFVSGTKMWRRLYIPDECSYRVNYIFTVLLYVFKIDIDQLLKMLTVV